MGNAATRCAGCGKVFETGTKSMRVSTGESSTKGFSEEKEWGFFHRPCFESSLNSPELAFARMRKLATKAAKSKGKNA